MNEENIFDKTKFGDQFLTRDNKIARFLTFKHETYYCYLEIDGGFIITRHNQLGVCEDNNEYDIIPRYQEPINENELDKLETEYEESLGNDYYWNEHCDDGEGIHGVCSVCRIEDAFKAGYKKAKEENNI